MYSNIQIGLNQSLGDRFILLIQPLFLLMRCLFLGLGLRGSSRGSLLLRSLVMRCLLLRSLLLGSLLLRLRSRTTTMPAIRITRGFIIGGWFLGFGWSGATSPWVGAGASSLWLNRWWEYTGFMHNGWWFGWRRELDRWRERWRLARLPATIFLDFASWTFIQTEIIQNCRFDLNGVELHTFNAGDQLEHGQRGHWWIHLQ